ncbi:hypothetical protein IWQ60_002454 [Tieghemiomyces parasiticus]|uniref:Rpr2-domain-containing protein n=1 Tax=Tieghemiomyces parasiticus TaxID=78921 RepID=A0A9W8AHF2_9FUNG|nr:hypothetical protein IWQ60_002454 [Tieghemiomyces parasiticus]
MAKGKNGQQGGRKGQLPHADTFHRMNFLYQASMLLTTLTTRAASLDTESQATQAGSGPVPTTRDPKPETSLPTAPTADTSSSPAAQPVGSNPPDLLTMAPSPRPNPGPLVTRVTTPTTDLTPLARFYCHTLKRIGKRTVRRCDPHIKRSICKGCEGLLVPGITSRHTFRARPQKAMVVTCTFCLRKRRFEQRPGYQLFTDKEEHGIEPV